MQKGQTHRVVYTIGMQYAVGVQYTVDAGAKRSTHTVDLANMGGGDRYLKYKKVQPTEWRYAVGTQYAVGVSAKRSTHTVDSANMGSGD